jgi:hypothetical protein
MRSLLLAALVLAASPAFAKKAGRAPREGRYCAKAKVGTTAQDKKGNTLECKQDGKRARWVKK